MPPDSRVDPGTSHSYDEFLLAIERARHDDGDPAAMWGVLRDLGGQMANVRHEVANMKVVQDAYYTRLYGFRDEMNGRGGDIGELKAGQAGIRKAVIRVGWTVFGGVVAIVSEQLPSFIHSVINVH